MYTNGNSVYSGTTTLTNCTVSGNSATGNRGGLDNSTPGTSYADQLHRQRQLRRRRRRSLQQRHAERRLLQYHQSPATSKGVASTRPVAAQTITGSLINRNQVN